LAEALDDTRRLGQIAVFLSNHFYFMGAFDEAIAAGQRSLTLALATSDGVQQALAHLRLGIAYAAQGNYRRAIDCCSQTVAALEGAQRYERFGQVLVPAVHARSLLLWCYAELGAFAEGRALGAEERQIAEVVEHPGSLMHAYYGVGLLSLCQGDLHTALSFLEHAVCLCGGAVSPAYFPRLATALGAAYRLGGRVTDTIALLTQALEQLTAMTRTHFETVCSLPLSEAYLLDGRLEEAHALAERALALACAHPGRGNQAHALRLLGDIAARRAPPEHERAETSYRQGLPLAEELGMRPLQAHSHWRHLQAPIAPPRREDGIFVLTQKLLGDGNIHRRLPSLELRACWDSNQWC